MFADIDWNQLKKGITYAESDSVAELRTAPNTIGSFPVFINAATNECFVRLNDSWALVDGIPKYNPRDPRSTGFNRYRLTPRKQLYDPLQNQVVAA